MVKNDMSQTELNQQILVALNAAPMAVSEAVWELVSRCIPAEKRRIAETQKIGEHSIMIPWAMCMGNPQMVGWVRHLLLETKLKAPIVFCGKVTGVDYQYNIKDMETNFEILFGIPLDRKKIIFSRDEPELNWKQKFQGALHG